MSAKRIAYFYSSKPQPHQFTILVRSIPSSSGKNFSETVESFFTEYHPSTYLSHSMVHRTSKIQDLIVSILGERADHLTNSRPLWSHTLQNHSY
jgi:hypothetical protein